MVEVLAGVEVVGTVADRRHGRCDHREMLRQAAGHHCADCHFPCGETLMADAFGSQDILRGQSAVVQQGLDPFRRGRNNRQPISQALPEIVFQGAFPVVELPLLNLHATPL